MKHSRFVHLHVHTEHSLLDGMCRIDKLLERAHKLKMPALAITDHGNMYGVIEFYLQAQESGIKPIIGMEAYIAPGARTEKKAHGIKDASFHITLLAKDYTGYKNLMKLSSTGYLEGFYYKPRIDKEALGKYREGLICLSGCLKGEISHLVVNNQLEQADSVIKQFIDIFGRDNFFLEMQDHGISEQAVVNRQLVDMAKRYQLEMVATNDCHYINSKEAYAHELLLCVQTATNLSDPKHMRFQTQEFYFKDEDEMRRLFSSVPAAIENTIKIAEMCNVELDFSKKHLPMFTPPCGESRELYLRKLCEEGLKYKCTRVTEEAVRRLNHELEIINKMNYASYFLIVWDIIRYARENGILVGPGRGSAAGSLVSFLLGITNINPLEYGLVFERFLNPSRITLPDIDIDFCDRRRDEVIDYVRNKYCKDNVAQIVTFGTLGAKAVVRDVGRGLGLSYNEADRIAKLIPNELNITLKRSLELEPRLTTMMKEDPRITKLIETSFELEGLARNVSTHAAGVVISSEPLTFYVPLATGTKGEIVTQYAMGPLEKIGMLKMDFLGLKTLSVIKDTVSIVKEREGIRIDIDRIPMNDLPTYSLLNKANTVGIFQLESTGMRDLAKRIGLGNFNDMIALVALFRPGPMHMLEDYVSRKHGKVPIKYEHPLLEPVLKDTYGVMLYQEQVMQCANIIGGFSMAEADTLRQIMGKKIADKMEEQRERFTNGAKKLKVSHLVSERIFETMASFAGYGFNKSHSTAYAMIAYQTAYLKANWPLPYMASLLTSEINNTDKLSRYIDECKKMGIHILPPDINQSEAHFTIVEGDIRFGLAAVKNVGIAAVGSILEVRKKNGEFRNFEDFLKRVDSRAVNKKVIESLIKCGAMDGFGYPRRQMAAGLDDAMKTIASRLKIERSPQRSFLFILDNGMEKEDIRLPEIDEWPQSQLLSFEKELLGFYVTGHPLAEYENLIKWYNTANVSQLIQLQSDIKVRIGGIITSLKRTVTKREQRQMAIVSLDGLDGVAEVVIYPDVYEQYSQYIENNKAVIVKGQAQSQEEKPRIIASEIVPLEEAPARYAELVVINLFDTRLDDGILTEVNNIIRQYPGKCVINFCVNLSSGDKVTMAVNSDLKVNPSQEFISKVEGALGEGSAWVKVGK